MGTFGEKRGGNAAERSKLRRKGKQRKVLSKCLNGGGGGRRRASEGGVRCNP